MYVVYILKSLKTGHHYIGSTQDLQRRLAEHNRGQSRSTRPHRPYVLIYTENLTSLAAARKREQSIKKMKNGFQFKRLIAVRNKIADDV